MARSKSVRKRVIINIVTSILTIIILTLILFNGVLIASGNKGSNSSAESETQSGWESVVETDSADETDLLLQSETGFSVASTSITKESETEKESETDAESESETETEKESETEAQTETEAVAAVETEAPVAEEPVVEEPQEEPQEEAPQNTGGVYVLPESNTRYIDTTELAILDLSQNDLLIARNEIYARHGRGFSDSSLQAYFDSQGWYQQRYSAEEFDAMGGSMFNEFESVNLATLLQFEAEKGYR